MEEATRRRDPGLYRTLTDPLTRSRPLRTRLLVGHHVDSPNHVSLVTKVRLRFSTV